MAWGNMKLSNKRSKLQIRSTSDATFPEVVHEHMHMHICVHVCLSLYVSEHLCVGLIMYMWALMYIRCMFVYLHVQIIVWCLYVCVCVVCTWGGWDRADWQEQISRGLCLPLDKPRSDSLVVRSFPLSSKGEESFESLGGWPYLCCCQPSPLDCEHSGLTIPINLRAKNFLGKARWSSEGSEGPLDRVPKGWYI